MQMTDLPGEAPASLAPLRTATQLPVEPQAPGSAPAGDPLNTVGLALLAYGLVQLLSKLMDKLPLGRSGAEHRGAGFTEEDRKRLERSVELLASDHQHLQRVQEQLATQQRLIGQALDELRDTNKRLDDVLRKLRALWLRLGRRRGDLS